jgi:hypothetical protein
VRIQEKSRLDFLCSEDWGMTMESSVKRFCVIAALATTVASFSGPASAGWYYRPGWSPGAAAAVGVLGGLAVGSAIAANARPVPAPVYVAPPPPEAECYVERRRVWVPGWGWELRRATVCE